MSNVPSSISTTYNIGPLHFTESALKHIKRLCKMHTENKGVYLKLRKGGCSGYEYEWQTTTKAIPYSQVFPLTTTEYCLYIDEKDYKYFTGMMVDYIREGLNGHLDIHNPHEKNACGCGKSFQLEE